MGQPIELQSIPPLRHSIKLCCRGSGAKIRAMNSTRSTSRLRYLPLMTLAVLLATSSAASCFCVTAAALQTASQRHVVARGHLTGTRDVQQVVTWRTRANSPSANGMITHLAIENAGRDRRMLWQAEEPFPAVDINSVQVVDLDGDSIPELLGLWWQSGSRGAVLRVFHWDRRSNNFAELPIKRGDASNASIQSYRLRGGAGRQRIVVYTRATVAAGEFELRGSEIVPVGGGVGVSTQGSSGIEGQALISPIHGGPVRVGESDTAPFKTTLVVLRASDGAEVARLETGSDGRFRVALPPGTYNVGPPANTGRRLPRGGQETVTVLPGKVAHVTINFDSGMR